MINHGRKICRIIIAILVRPATMTKRMMISMKKVMETCCHAEADEDWRGAMKRIDLCHLYLPE